MNAFDIIWILILLGIAIIYARHRNKKKQQQSLKILPYCPGCGSKISMQSEYCPECGTELVNDGD
jgi:rRNA maturation endonuclease Nob1